MNSYISIAIIIILLFPFPVLAHGLEPELRVEPGKLPGELAYIVERPAEWLSVNIFTISTKKKQAKKLTFASERIVELGALLYVPKVRQKHIDQALNRYRYYLENAEDMAEKIIFLDGREIAIAEKFEEETRLQEKYLRELAEGAAADKLSPAVYEALAIVRVQNEKMFKFMVEKYQATDADIRKHRAILSKHMALVREAMQALKDEEKIKQVSNLLVEAEKFRKAGLNIEAYNLIKQAKDIIY